MKIYIISKVFWFNFINKNMSEYWIEEDGDVQFADGDVGDYNHEGAAIEHIYGEFQEKIAALADKLGIEYEFNKWGEIDTEAVKETLVQIHELLTERKKRPMSSNQASSYTMRSIGANEEAFRILWGGSGAADYAMEHYGWIAVRSNNVEFYGWNQRKKEQIANGLQEILSSEGGWDNEEEEEEEEFSLTDNETGKHWYMTLAQLEAPETTAAFPTAYPNLQIATATYHPNSKFGRAMKAAATKLAPPSDENKDSKPVKSKEYPWKIDGRPDWRMNSESRWPGFYTWLERKKCELL